MKMRSAADMTLRVLGSLVTVSFPVLSVLLALVEAGGTDRATLRALRDAFMEA